MPGHDQLLLSAVAIGSITVVGTAAIISAPEGTEHEVLVVVIGAILILAGAVAARVYNGEG